MSSTFLDLVGTFSSFKGAGTDGTPAGTHMAEPRYSLRVLLPHPRVLLGAFTSWDQPRTRTALDVLRPRALAHWQLHRGCSAFLSVPEWAGGALSLSACIVVLSMAIISSFISTAHSAGSMPPIRGLAPGLPAQTLLDGSSMLGQPCPSCLLIPGSLLLSEPGFHVWLNVAQGSLAVELLVSYIIAAMVVAFSIFLVGSFHPA